MDNLQARLAYAERIAVFYEKAGGIPRMAGRIMGWLLVCDPPQQNATELAQVLSASKGSISTMTRWLLHIGLINKTTIPGERRDYFEIREGTWADLLAQQFQAVGSFRELANQGLALLNDPKGHEGARLREMHDLYAFFERELPLLIEKWRNERKE
ncbi:GbsR/MarR family transcriptional regulator [Herpetosiphon geysericola]|uniref:MarR family transcriptional regulator n=1 Tax=Herpetosiphon geysericola TaxID=70996 RepID=A0A0P6XNV5_9CHLR|nr:MarR family transcriptional regulator [Herpetosiphon geysericola]KPL85339.1 MarR family transcriptional regulator [Herpetosiphon geysericola]